MSDANAEAPKKKGKLPIIIILVAVVGGGGFFMKSKGAKKEEPAVKLAKIDQMVELKDEFLVNLAGGQNYLKCKISLLPAATAKKADIEKFAPVILDTINQRLRSTTISFLSQKDGVAILKRQLAQDVNHQLEILMADPEHAKPEAKAPKKRQKQHEEEQEKLEEITKLPTPDEVDHPEWDHDEGPILKIFFTSFATQ